MKTKLLALMLLAGSTVFAAPGVFFGVGIGGGGYIAPPPPRPPVVVGYRAPYPGPGYSWVNGYYGWGGGAYAWRPGYWAHPPFAGARWNGPHYDRGRYYGGYWRR